MMRGFLAAVGVGAAAGAMAGGAAWGGAHLLVRAVDIGYRLYDYWQRKRHET